MNAPIIYIGGSKGGVGKSKMSFALIDYLRRNKEQVLLVESDNANPDVYKAHVKLTHGLEDEGLVCKILDLDTAEGWIELVNEADKYPDHTLVINSAARSVIKTLGHQKLRGNAQKHAGRTRPRDKGKSSPFGLSTGKGISWNCCTCSWRCSPKPAFMCAATYTLAKQKSLSCTIRPSLARPWKRNAQHWTFPPAQTLGRPCHNQALL